MMTSRAEGKKIVSDAVKVEVSKLLSSIPDGATSQALREIITHLVDFDKDNHAFLCVIIMEKHFPEKAELWKELKLAVGVKS